MKNLFRKGKKSKAAAEGDSCPARMQQIFFKQPFCKIFKQKLI
jgi:hypothetical protein